MADRSNLFKDLQKGTGITGGLKHVDKAEVQQTKQAAGPAGTSARAGAPPSTAEVKVEPRRQGDKWFIVCCPYCAIFMALRLNFCFRNERPISIHVSLNF